MEKKIQLTLGTDYKTFYGCTEISQHVCQKHNICRQALDTFLTVESHNGSGSTWVGSILAFKYQTKVVVTG